MEFHIPFWYYSSTRNSWQPCIHTLDWRPADTSTSCECQAIEHRDFCYRGVQRKRRKSVQGQAWWRGTLITFVLLLHTINFMFGSKHIATVEGGPKELNWWRHSGPAVRRELGHTAALHTTHIRSERLSRLERLWLDIWIRNCLLFCLRNSIVLFSLDLYIFFFLFFGSVIKQEFVSSLSEMLESYALIVCTEAKKSKSGRIYVLVRSGGMRNGEKLLQKIDQTEIFCNLWKSFSVVWQMLFYLVSIVNISKLVVARRRIPQWFHQVKWHCSSLSATLTQFE